MTPLKSTLVAAAVVLALSPAARAQDADTVLATVNGVEITLGHLIAMRERLPDNYQALPDDVLYNGMLDQLIQQELLAASIREELTRAQSLGLENETRAFLAGQIVETASGGAVTEAELQAAYEAEYAPSAPEVEFNAAHILVATQQEAASLVSQLSEGADFAELARTFSTGPSGPNGGALGWFGLGRMVPAFEQAVLALDVGAVSPPVETQFGWHVIILNDKRELGAPPFEDVRQDLEVRIREQRFTETLAALEEAATITRSDVTVDPVLIRDSDLLAD